MSEVKNENGEPREVQVSMAPEVKNAIENVKEGYQAAMNKLADKAAALEEQVDALGANMKMFSVRDTTQDDPKRGYKNYIAFFEDVKNVGMGMAPSERLKNAVGSDEAKIASNPDGGFLIPPAFFSEILKSNAGELQFDIGSRTRKIPVNAQIATFNARVDKDHSTSVSGGLRMYRREEAGTVTASKMQFKQIRLEMSSLVGISYATEEILTNAPESFSALLLNSFMEEYVSKLNEERLRGTGVGQYLGVLNSDALVTVAKEGSQTADTVTGNNVIAMKARAWGYNNAVWMVNHDVYPQLPTINISGSKSDNFLFAPGNGTDTPDTLLGRPVVMDENMSTLGDVGDILLVNWGEYLEGYRGNAEWAESMHVRFIYNERAFRFATYNAGAPWWDCALTPKRSTATLSPFVTLAAR